MFFEEELRGAAALAATGMMIPRMVICVNRVFEYFLTRPFGREGSEGSEGSKGSKGSEGKGS